MEFIFWLSITSLSFFYLGYGILIFIINKFSRKIKRVESNNALPSVALVIAAFNEEKIIEEKIYNSLALNYPAGKLQIYVVADGSSDQTISIVRKFADVRLLWKPVRKGKPSAINHVMQHIKEPVTIFTDANVMLNKEAVRNLVAHYNDPKTGAVSGEKRVLVSGSAEATEGFYWKYESFLKEQDARFSTLVGAAGELFSIRTCLYEDLPEDTLLDDFIISMNIIRKGFRIGYEPLAYASERPSRDIGEEYKRKVRIGAGGLQSVIRLKDFVNPIRYGVVSLQFIFHRFARWILAPVFIPVAFITNIYLLREGALYYGLFLAQLTFHLLSILGWILENKKIRLRVFFIPFYFNFMHFCILAGWLRYIMGKQNVVWQKAERSIINLQ